jgi:hypothetical protein
MIREKYNPGEAGYGYLKSTSRRVGRVTELRKIKSIPCGLGL